MESIATEPEIQVAHALQSAVGQPEWQDALVKVRAYLAAWRVGDEGWLEECTSEIVAAAQKRVQMESDIDPTRAALDEADGFLRSWFEQIGSASIPERSNDGNFPLQTRIALIYGAPAGEFTFSDRTAVLAALRQGSLNYARALTPARAPETRAMTMQTSLSRLPSIRLIAGWMLLIALLFVAFFLTH